MRQSRSKVVPIRRASARTIPRSEFQALRWTEETAEELKQIGLRDYADRLEVVRVVRAAEIATDLKSGAIIEKSCKRGITRLTIMQFL